MKSSRRPPSPGRQTGRAYRPLAAWPVLLVTTAVLLFGSGVKSTRAAKADIASYAIVQEDGTLVTGGNHRLRLYGIYIPETDRTCRTFQVPIRCGPRAVLALDFKINGHFIFCDRRGVHEDGTVNARCRVKDEDLSKWMLEQGWAVALPDAPLEYKIAELIARRRNLGIWGTFVDVPAPGSLRRRAIPENDQDRN